MKPTFIHYYTILVIAFAILIITATAVYLLKRSHKQTDGVKKQTMPTCGAHKCSALDPVNEPEYNMKNIVKQSILLEEHLAEDNKYCESCIVKHFQHIIGLAEEAVWLAGDKVGNYPNLDNSVGLYQKMFDKWINNRDDKNTRKHVLTDLRENRRTLIDKYFLI